jgi:NDP-sugar pyrophosphorylase family protein
MKPIAIVYMVAGISSRFGGKIKQFAKVGPNQETLIEYSLNQALKSGFDKIIFIVGNKTEIPFKEKFKDNYQRIPVFYALQTYDESKRDKPWGTGDALCSAKEIIDCPFVVCNGDDIYGENAFKILFEHLSKNNNEATLGYNLINVLPDQGKTHRAIFQIDKNDYIKELREIFNIEKSNLQATNNKPDDLCSMNIYALHPKTIEFLNNNLKIFKEQNKDDRKIEFLIPNELSNLIKENKIKMKLYPCNEKWIGITNPEDEEIVRNILSRE